MMMMMMKVKRMGDARCDLLLVVVERKREIRG